MSKQRSKAPEITTEEVKNLLDKEQVCLLKAKEAIQQQLKVLQAEAATIQRLIVVQEQGRSATEPVVQSLAEPSGGQTLDITSGKLPELNLQVTPTTKNSANDEEVETDSESSED